MQTSNDFKFTIGWNDQINLPLLELVNILKIFGDQLPEPLSQRMDLFFYAKKLEKNAEIALAFHDQEIVGFLAMYANDLISRKAHIPIVSVLSNCRGNGIGKALLSRAIALARQRGMTNLWLTVDHDNYIAQHVYSECRFIITSTTDSKWIMNRDLSINTYMLEPQLTPLEDGKILSAQFGLDIDLRIKRDDLYPLPGGGSKARKIGFIVKKAIKDGYDAIVTNGGPQSNHARASSILAANLGLICHLVIVLEDNKKYSKSGNILLMKLSGADIEFTTKDLLATRMDQAIEKLVNRGHKPLYIWGGGHNFEGTEAFVDAATEAQRQCEGWTPDYLILASGTGSTQAGLAIGYTDLRTKVIGISVARESVRGSEIISNCINDYYFKSQNQRKDVKVVLRDDWTFGGYERYDETLFGVIERAAKCGYFFDPTYSGKALLGLTTMVKNGEIRRGSKVLLWHTGGLMNLQAVLDYTEGTFNL